jgi:hypothetical protein
MSHRRLAVFVKQTMSEADDRSREALMAERTEILIRVGGTGAWASPETMAYTDEAHLRDLLAQDPGRIPGVSAEALTVRELPTTAGFVDVTAIDEDGSITVVECKLGSNRDERRKVIGQVQDYASAVWQTGFESFQQNWTSRGGELLSDRLDVDALRALERNIESARIHLCVAVDRIDDDLRRLIEYLNEISRSDVAVTAIQLEYAQHGDTEILVPTTFGGEIAAVKARESGQSTEHWTRDTYLESIADPDDRRMAEALLERVEQSLDAREGNNGAFWFGARPFGGVQPHPHGLRFPPVQLWVNSAGRATVSGAWKLFPRVAGHTGFRHVADVLGQSEVGPASGVPLVSLDLEALWAAMVETAREVNASAHQPDDFL